MRLAIICWTLAASILVGFSIPPTNSLTFEQRWAPVSDIDNGLKSNKLEVRPPVRIMLACNSFCEFP